MQSTHMQPGLRHRMSARRLLVFLLLLSPFPEWAIATTSLTIDGASTMKHTSKASHLSLPELSNEGRTIAAILYDQGYLKPRDVFLGMLAPIVIVTESGAVIWSEKATEGLPGPPYLFSRISPHELSEVLLGLQRDKYVASPLRRYQHVVVDSHYLTVFLDAGAESVIVQTSKPVEAFTRWKAGESSDALRLRYVMEAPDNGDRYVEALVGRILSLIPDGGVKMDTVTLQRRRLEYNLLVP